MNSLIFVKAINQNEDKLRVEYLFFLNSFYTISYCSDFKYLMAENYTTYSPEVFTERGISTLPSWIGYIALTISVLFFGSNWVPIKKVESGDGMKLINRKVIRFVARLLVNF